MRNRRDGAAAGATRLPPFKLLWPHKPTSVPSLGSKCAWRLNPHFSPRGMLVNIML